LNLSGAWHVPDELLHVRVFQPELRGTREDGDRPVPDVPGVVHLLVAHLHLGVLQPNGHIPVVNVQTALEHRASALQLANGLLPLD
jgi:hypothetical protein